MSDIDIEDKLVKGLFAAEKRGCKICGHKAGWHIPNDVFCKERCKCKGFYKTE